MAKITIKTSTKKQQNSSYYKSAVAVKASKGLYKKLAYYATSQTIKPNQAMCQIIESALTDPSRKTLSKIKAYNGGDTFTTEVRMRHMTHGYSKNIAKAVSQKVNAVVRCAYLPPVWQMQALDDEAAARGFTRPMLVARILELELQGVEVPANWQPKKKMKVAPAMTIAVAYTPEEYAKLKGKVFVTRTKSLVQKLKKNLKRVTASVLKSSIIARKAFKANIILNIQDKAIAKQLKIVAKRYDTTPAKVARAAIFA